MRLTHSEVAVGSKRAHAEFESDCESSLIRLLRGSGFWTARNDLARKIECPSLQCAVARVTRNLQRTFNRLAGASVLPRQAVRVGQIHEAYRCTASVIRSSTGSRILRASSGSRSASNSIE